MTLTLDVERKAFEKWVSAQPWFLATLYLARSGDEYADSCINSRWQGWKAHRLSQPAQAVDTVPFCRVEDVSGFDNDSTLAQLGVKRGDPLFTRAIGTAQGWREIASAPKGKPILVHYKNELGKGRTVKAYYVERFTEESSPDSENDEYNEADDTYYTLPGWYEIIDNWEDYSAVFIHRDPTLWMPLPTPPTDGGDRDGMAAYG